VHRAPNESDKFWPSAKPLVMAVSKVDDQAFFINLRSQNFLQIVIDFTSGRWEIAKDDPSWPLEIVTLGKNRVRIHEDGTCELLDKRGPKS
jgi:hypothetical protein